MLKRIVCIAAALIVPTVLAAQTPRRATRVRGQAVGLDNRPVTPATRATGATPAQPGAGEGGRAIPATRPTPATPASPSRKPADAGTGHGRRP